MTNNFLQNRVLWPYLVAGCVAVGACVWPSRLALAEPVGTVSETVMDFEDLPVGAPPQDWGLWIKDGKGGVVADGEGFNGAGALKFSGVEIASMQRDFLVKPGEVVDVEVLARQAGAGAYSFMVYGLKADNTLNYSAATYKGKFAGFEGDWRQGKVRLLTPAGVAALRVVLIAEKQASPQDAVWFDRLVIRKEFTGEPAKLETGHAPPRFQVDFSAADNPLPISNRDTFNTLRMVTVIHGDVEGNGPYKRITPANTASYVKNLRASGYNMVLTDGQRYLMGDNTEHAPYPDVLVGSLPFPELVANTKSLADACHDEGLKIFLHITAGTTSMERRLSHPEQMAVSVNDGQPHTIWGLEWLCLNNPEFQAEYFKRLDELVRETKADGLMVDETTLMLDTCGCPICRAKFTADTGLQMPPQGTPWLGDFSNPVYREFLEWRLTVCTDFNDKIRNLLRKHNADGELFSYYANPLNPKAWADHGFSSEVAGTVSKTLGFEMISNYSKYWALFIANMKYVRSVAEQNDGDIFSISNPPGYEGIYQNWVMNMSQGAHQYWPWYIPDAVKEERKPLVQWEAKNRESLAGLRAGADTAVVMSTRNNNLHQNPLGPVNLHNSYFAICNTLTMAQVPYRALGDKDLDKALSGKANTIIALNLSLVSEAQAANLRRFVNDGGTLITATDFSLYDEKGQRRKNFALADIMGCDYVSTVQGDGVLQVEKTVALLDNVTGSFESPELAVRVAVRPGTASLGTIKLGSGETVPGLLSRQVGKGRVVYFAGQIEPLLYFNQAVGNEIISRSYQEKRDEQMEKLLLGLVKNSSGEKVSVSNLPRGVVLETYRHDYKGQAGMMVSLSNFTGMLSEGRPEALTYGYFDILSKAPQVGKPVRISWRGKATKAYAISPDFAGKKELALTKGEGEVSVELAKLGNLTMVYFE